MNSLNGSGLTMGKLNVYSDSLLLNLMILPSESRTCVQNGPHTSVQVTSTLSNVCATHFWGCSEFPNETAGASDGYMCAWCAYVLNFLFHGHSNFLHAGIVEFHV